MDAIAPNSARDSGNEDPAAAMQAARLADIITEQLQQCASKASEARLAATRMLRAAASAATQFGKAGPKAVHHLAGALATSCAVAVVATCKESMGVAVSDINQPMHTGSHSSQATKLSRLSLAAISTTIGLV